MSFLRDTNLHGLETQTFDVVVLGGGINGSASAAALASRGARVALIDAGDFASGSSQQSSNLAWGGIKYMESHEFGLVTKLCASRNELMRSYPSSVQEIRFLTSHERGFRHGLWKLVAGTWLYWLMGRAHTEPPRLLSCARLREEEPVVDVRRCTGAFEYSDAYLLDNDARFVFRFIRTAMDRGCLAANYVESLGAVHEAGVWRVSALDRSNGRRFSIRARTLVNACGPHTDDHNRRSGQVTRHRHIFSKGVHLIVDRITRERRILTFFADDGRLFFAIPMGDKTCIGTTDTLVDDPRPEVTDDDRDFILDNINKRLARRPLTRADIIAERCGVRPLVLQGGDATTNWLQMSRKHVVEVNTAQPCLSIFGGKLTDCLNVGEEVCEALTGMGLVLPHRNRRWYGEPEADIRDAFYAQCQQFDLDRKAPTASGESQAERLWRLYAEQSFALLDTLRGDLRLARVLIPGTEYMACEFNHTAEREMVVRLEDFLRRRSLIALTVRHQALERSSGLREACELLFGRQAAAERYAEYFVTPSRAVA